MEKRMYLTELINNFDDKYLYTEIEKTKDAKENLLPELSAEEEYKYLEAEEKYYEPLSAQSNEFVLGSLLGIFGRLSEYEPSDTIGSIQYKELLLIEAIEEVKKAKEYLEQSIFKLEEREKHLKKEKEIKEEEDKTMEKHREHMEELRKDIEARLHDGNSEELQNALDDIKKYTKR